MMDLKILNCTFQTMKFDLEELESHKLDTPNLEIGHGKFETFEVDPLCPKIGHENLETFKLDTPNLELRHGILETFKLDIQDLEIGHPRL
jgi:hypothetical protein